MKLQEKMLEDKIRLKQEQSKESILDNSNSTYIYLKKNNFLLKNFRKNYLTPSKPKHTILNPSSKKKINFQFNELESLEEFAKVLKTQIELDRELETVKNELVLQVIFFFYFFLILLK